MDFSSALPNSIQDLITEVTAKLADRPKLAAMFATCLPNTYQTTLKQLVDGTVFVITGDIPAMWLRDSTAQVRPYLRLAASDPAMANLIEGVIKRQISYILLDPYANAFNEEPNGNSYDPEDITEKNDWLWERKYEIDSLCYPIQLAYLFWKATGRTNHLDEEFKRAARQVLTMWRTEQYHKEKSQYRFQRLNCPPTDTLSHNGEGSPVGYTGLTWSGFRPSDDSCEYHYLIPANMFATVVLGYLSEIAQEIWQDQDFEREVAQLKQTISEGLAKYATVQHPAYGTIYAYETDGLGNYNLMDDANVPSLLSLPYLGYCSAEDPIYRNTRNFILSAYNPYYYAGSYGRGIGSPHTPYRHVWPIALVMQALTTTDQAEIDQILTMLEQTEAGTDQMHESFLVDDPTKFTREWFAWANSLFSELILSCYH